jgi:LysR family glycine cleavage system transcriptional activator
MDLDWRQMPPLSALRAFEALSRHKSYSAAARSLSVTHAAIAQQVRGLEENLGISLVLRNGRGMALTAEGEQLALALADGFSVIHSGVAALRGGDGRPVRITLSPGFATQWLMPRLKNFWALHPDVALSLHPEHREVDLRREGMDLGIRYGNGDWPEVESRYLTSARLVVAGAPELLGGEGGIMSLDQAQDLSPEQMRRLPWVMSDNTPEELRWMQIHGLDPEGLHATYFPDEELTLAAARQGLGLIVESYALLEEDLRQQRLKVVFDSRDRLPGYFIVTPGGPQRRGAREVLAWLAKVV